MPQVGRFIHGPPVFSQLRCTNMNKYASRLENVAQRGPTNSFHTFARSVTAVPRLKLFVAGRGFEPLSRLTAPATKNPPQCRFIPAPKRAQIFLNSFPGVVPLVCVVASSLARRAWTTLPLTTFIRLLAWGKLYSGDIVHAVSVGSLFQRFARWPTSFRFPASRPASFG